MSTSNNPTEKDYEDWETLKKINPWHKIFDPEKKVLLEDVLNGKEFVHPKDREIIDNRNNHIISKGKNNVFVTSLLPKPYRGNLKDPKLVILSLNPSYKERVKKKLFKMLREEHQLQFIEIAKKNALLEDGCSINYDDVDEVTDNGYWVDKLSDLQEKGVDLSKIGLMQFIPYASESYDSWKEEGNLFTQQFSKKIILRLLYEEKSTLFLVMRSRKQWENLIGKKVMDKFKDNFLFNKHPICQTITQNNLMNKDKDASKQDQYQTILAAFNNNQ